MKDSLEDSSASVEQTALKDVKVGRNLKVGKITQIRGNIVKIIKKPVSIAFGVLTASVGVVGIIFAEKHNVIDNRQGTIESGATVANELTIYQGDPPEVRQKKLEKAKNLIAEEIFTNISNMDARLSYVGTTLENEEEDNFAQRLRDVRNQVAPSANNIFDSDYNRLTRQQEISSLRGGFASRPLYEAREPLIQVLIEGDADVKRVQAFYSSLAEVHNVSESLLQELSTATTQTSTDLKEATHYKKREKLAVKRLLNLSEIAYLSGLMVLDSLKIPPPNAQERLSSLQHLEPRQLITREEATQLLATQLRERERLVAEKVVILEEAKNLVETTLDKYAKLNEKLVIKTSDPWNVVVGKAVSLRQFGRTTEAVAAFSRYADMFSEKDLTAKQYSQTAQQFTIQLNNLDVGGGVYLFEVVQNGIADRAGLKVGDIIIGYGDKTIANMDDIMIALRDNSKGDLIRLTYLRMNDAGVFQRQTVTINSGSLGVGMMPI
jgi:hypothetical protein